MAGTSGEQDDAQIVFEDGVVDREPSESSAPKRLSRRAVVLGGVGVVGGLSAVRFVISANERRALVDQPISRRVDVTLPVGEFDEVDGITRFTTPTSDHFFLDIAIEKPSIDPETYSLTIGGPHARNPLTLSYDDLLGFEQVSRQFCLVCVSNPVGGELVGNVVWTGIPLSVLLDEAGIDDATNPERQILSHGADGYSAGFRAPLAYDGRTAMVALFMNGEPLPVENGFPARLVMAGEYAYTSATKWLERIEITDFIGVDGFWIPRGWAKEAPVKMSSRIDTVDRRNLTGPGATTIGGVAWAPSHGIERVEVNVSNIDDVTGLEQIDSGEWEQAELATVEADETWVQWRYEWDAPVGDWVLSVRATDKSGFTQGFEMVPAAPDGAEGYDSSVTQVA